MTKLLRVLTFLVVILGLGISCASAANVAVSFNTQTVELQPGSSQNVQILMNQVPVNGLSGFNISVSVADPTITNITAVSAPGWAGVSNTSTVPSGSVWITAANFNQVKAGDTNVSFGNITITGIKAGTTNLSIVPTEIDDSIGNLINPDVTMCQVNVISVLPVANFTSNVTSGSAPLIVQFNDTSLNETLGRTWTFGDGSPSTTDASPIHIFNNPGTFIVNLTASNANGTNNTSKTITVNPPPKPVLPVANFTSNVTSGFAPLTVQFNDTSLNETLGRTWTFGDGSPSTTDANPIHTYNNAGTFTVNLTARNANGTNNTSKTITVNAVPPTPVLPVANFTSNLTSGFAPLTVQFNDTSLNETLGRTWTFGDGSPSTTDANPIHIFNNVGTFTVNLTASNANGTNNTSKTISVNPPPKPVLPVANFTSNVTSGSAPLIVQFNDTSLNETLGRTWTFGDGSSSTTDANPIHIFNNPGTFTVNLTASNANGTNNTSKTITVNAVPPTPVLPVANFTSNVTSGFAPLTVQFNDTSLNETLGRTWTFGDGSPSTTDANPIHTYNNAGTFTVNLTASNANGTNNTSKTITVNAVPPAPTSLKINDFKADVTSGYEPLKVNFTSDVSGSPTRWIWKFSRFGRQSFKVGTATHTYDDYGVYDVTLTVRDAAGHTDSMTKKAYINVLKVPAPKANFTANVTSGKAPLTVQFTDMSKNSPTKRLWSFGDGRISTQQNPIHIYKRAGRYTVTLTVRNYAGINTKMIRNYITVKRN